MQAIAITFFLFGAGVGLVLGLFLGAIAGVAADKSQMQKKWREEATK